MQVFWLQIVDQEGQVVTGMTGKLELDVIHAVTEAILARKVGIGRTEAHVRMAILDGMLEVFSTLKNQTVPLALAEFTRRHATS